LLPGKKFITVITEININIEKKLRNGGTWFGGDGKNEGESLIWREVFKKWVCSVQKWAYFKRSS
jgi:hypothetical protein